ncbi:MAG: hypothetical protein HOI29_02500 [Planctomycetes bacterium]|nr:hypothetical protein [Planctomycetota bacterium]
MPLLRGDESAIDPNRPLFWHMPHFWGPRGPGILPFSSIRQGPWKMIYYHHPLPTRVLYHLGDDLAEKNDLSKENPQVLATLSASLGKHLRQVKAGMPSRAGRMIPYPDRLMPSEKKTNKK